MSEKPFDIIEELRKMFQAELEAELDRAHEKLMRDLTPPPGWKGFTGIRSIFDEAAKIVPAVFPPKPTAWTPKEFEVMWRRRSHVQKIVFVLDLIS